MIKPEIDLELSIKALEVYGIEPNIIKSMLTNLQKVVKQNCNLHGVINSVCPRCYGTGSYTMPGMGGTNEMDCGCKAK